MPRLPDDTTLGQRPEPVPAGGLAQYRPAEIRGLEVVGQAEMQVGQEFAHTFKVMQEQADTTRVEDAWNQYKAAALDVTNGEKGVLNLKGGDAVNGNILDSAKKRMDDAKARISGGLASDEQRARFATRAASTDLQVQHQALVHLDQEHKAYSKIVLDGSVASANSLVAANPTDDIAFLTQKTNVINQARTYLKMNGVNDSTEGGKMAGDAYVAKVVDGLWASRIDSLLSMNLPLQADKLFRDNAGEIKNPELRMTLRARTQEGAVIANATITTDEDIAKGMDKLLREKAKEPARATPEGGPATGPISVRQNNPGNITDATGTIRTFATKEEGERALDAELRLKLGGNSPAYKRRFGNQPVTPERLAETWSPAAAKGNSQDSTTNYGKAIASALGISPDQEIPNTADAMAKVKSAITAFEAGGSGMQTVSARTQAVYPDTSGLPNAKDVAALKSQLMAQTETRADELYGKDVSNPARMAFVKHRENEITTKINRRAAELNAIQADALDTVKTRVIGPVDNPMMTVGAGGASKTGLIKVTSWSQLMSDPVASAAVRKLDGAGRAAIDTMLKVAANETPNGDSELFNTIRNEIANGKIQWGDEILKDPRVQAGNLNLAQIHALEGWAKASVNEEGRTQAAIVKQGVDMAKRTFGSMKELTLMGLAPRAEALFSQNASQVVAKYRKEGKDVSPLFDITKPDSLISPQALDKWKILAQAPDTPAEALAAMATATRAPAVPPVQMPSTVTDAASMAAWVKTLPETQTSFIDTKGQLRTIPGRTAAPAAAAVPGAPTPAAQAAPAGTPPDQVRPDGTLKGKGFLGELKFHDGRTSTELSVGVNIGGKEMDIPTLVPTLTKPEVDSLLKGDRPSDTIVEKAVAHAKARLAAGKSVFAQPGEAPVAPAAAKKDPDALPIFKSQGGLSPEEQQQHLGGLWAAAKAVAKASFDLEPAGRAIAGGVSSLVNAVIGHSQEFRETESRAMFQHLLQRDQFTPLDVPVVRAAIKYGNLDPGDLKKAKAMLKAAGG